MFWYYALNRNEIFWIRIIGFTFFEMSKDYPV